MEGGALAEDALRAARHVFEQAHEVTKSRPFPGGHNEAAFERPPIQMRVRTVPGHLFEYLLTVTSRIEGAKPEEEVFQIFNGAIHDGRKALTPDEFGDWVGNRLASLFERRSKE